MEQNLLRLSIKKVLLLLFFNDHILLFFPLIFLIKLNMKYFETFENILFLII